MTTRGRFKCKTMDSKQSKQLKNHQWKNSSKDGRGHKKPNFNFSISKVKFFVGITRCRLKVKRFFKVQSSWWPLLHKFFGSWPYFSWDIIAAKTKKIEPDKINFCMIEKGKSNLNILVSLYKSLITIIFIVDEMAHNMSCENLQVLYLWL